MASIGKDIKKAKQLLESGELVAIPTETVYGLAGNALNIQAVTRIFTTKNRPHFDPIIVHVSSVDDAARYVTSIPEKARILARLFWPGPLTLLLEKKPVIPDLVTAGLDSVAVRCPAHPMALELLSALDFPLAAPSANPFGYVSPTRAEHVNEQLGDKIPYILDGGPCTIGIESTIVGFDRGQTRLYRLGGLSLEKIQSAIGPVVLQTGSTESPVAPGQLSKHYSPGKHLVLGNLSELVKKVGKNGQDVGVLAFAKLVPGVAPENQIVLSPSEDLEVAAQQLFGALRELDRRKVKMILAEEVPDVGIGRAINDRLRRAAAKT